MGSHLKLPVKFGFQDLLVVAMVLTLLRQQFAEFADDPGVGWHLKGGEYFIKHWSVPRLEPFVYPLQSGPWISQAWLSDVLLYCLYATGSWALCYAFLSFLYLSVYELLVYGRILKPGAGSGHGRLSAAVASLFAFKLGLVHFIFRPVIFGFFFFALLYALLLRMREGWQPAAGRLRITFGHFLQGVLIFALWANMHPSFVFGFMLLAAAALDGLVAGIKAKGFAGGLRGTGPLAGFCLLSALAVLINPYGASLLTSVMPYTGAVHLLPGSADPYLHPEWQALDFGSVEGRLFLWTAVIIALGLFVSGPGRNGIFEGMALLCTGVAAVAAVRCLPYFGIAAALPLARALSTLCERLLGGWQGPLEKLRSMGERWSTREALTGQGFYVLLLYLVYVLTAAVLLGRLPLMAGEPGPNRDKYPYQALEFLVQTADPAPRVVAAGAVWGGFITWQGQGRVLPLIDDRSDRGLYSRPDFYAEFHQMLSGKAGWPDYFKALGASYLLVSPHDPIVEKARRRGLEEVFSDQVAVLFRLESES